MKYSEKDPSKFQNTKGEKAVALQEYDSAIIHG